MNTFLKAKFKYLYNEEQWIESVWVSKADENYIIENSPFYVLNYSLGDIISVQVINGELFVNGLVKPSGNSTIHVVFFNKGIVQDVRDKLRDMGCSSELSNLPSLISVNVPKEIDYTEVRTFLGQGIVNDLWDFQEACIGHI